MGFTDQNSNFVISFFLSGFAVWILQILMFPIQQLLSSNTLWKGKPSSGPRQFASTNGRMMIIELGQIGKDSETRLIFPRNRTEYTKNASGFGRDK